MRGDSSIQPTIAGKVVKLRSTKKDFSMSQGKNKMKVRTFKKPVASTNVRVLPLLPLPEPKPKACLRKTSSTKDMDFGGSRSNKTLEGKSFFCKYLLEQPNEGILEIDVSDDGCGISAEDKTKLFKPFSQANKGVHSKYGGTGLGLWLSQKLVTAMKGSLLCDSEVGKGTTFRVIVPTKCRSGKLAAKVILVKEWSRGSMSTCRDSSGAWSRFVA
jgi:hypothetical protein